MIECEEFTAEILNDGQTEPDTQMRVTNRLKPDAPPRIYTYNGPYVVAAYVNEHGFLDIKRFCAEVVFHDAGCDEW